MIESYNDLKSYIAADKAHYSNDTRGFVAWLLEKPKFLIQRYLYWMRLAEYAVNVMMKSRSKIVSVWGGIEGVLSLANAEAVMETWLSVH